MTLARTAAWLAGVSMAAMCVSTPAHAAAGRTEGTAAVGNDGAAQYSIPIRVPAGTRGMQPSLSLTYGSGGGSGWIGVGWNIGGLSSVTRCDKTWAQDGEPRNVRLDYNDRYCLDGNRLRLVAGSHGGDGAEYRTEIEAFTRVKSFGAAGNGPARFIAELKNGLIYEYGNTGDSRIESLGVATARAWAVNKIRDRDGNAMLFTYAEDTTNGSYRLDSVQYTANEAAGLPATYRIQFVYETQPASEIDSGYLGGRLIKDITRLTRVDVTYDTALVRRYHIAYQPGLSSTGKSRVQSIQECAGSSGSDCLSATRFTYQDGTPGIGPELDTGEPVPATAWPLDVNGDGRKDLVYSSSLTAGGGTWKVMLANNSGGYHPAIDTSIANSHYSQAIAIDYNADGLDDLLVPYAGGTWWVMLGTASGLAAPVNTGTPATATGVGVNAHAIDIDGDGLQDLVWADLAGFAGGDAIRYRLRIDGGAFSSSVSTLVGPMAADSMIRNPVWGFPNLPGSRNPDFNGDGRDDLLYQRRDRVFIDGPNTWTYTDYTTAVMPGGSSAMFITAQVSAPVYGDFNGDGYDDVLYITGAIAARLRFGTGTGFTAELLGPNPSAYQGGWLAYDWNADGADDLLARNAASGAWDLIHSTGEGFAAPVSTGLSTADLAAVADLNGDGLQDLAYQAGGVWKSRLHAGSSADLLATASDGFGNVAGFAYTSIVQGNYSKYADAIFPEQDYAGPLTVVHTMTASTGIGSTYAASYWYYGARVHRQGRGFEGFHARRTQDSRNDLYAYDYFHRLFPYSGARYQSDLYQPNGSTLISRVQHTWTSHWYGSGSETRRLPFVSQSTATRHEVGGAYNGALISTATTSSTVDAASGIVYDSTTTTVEAATANGVQAGAAYVQRVYQPITSLVSDTASWCLGRPGQIQSLHSHDQYGGAAITRTASLTWDTVKCRPTEVVIEPGHAQLQVTRSLGYDGFGNLASDTLTGIGMSGRTTSTSWGPSGQFPVWVSDALSQSRSFEWDYALGVATRATDPNGIATLWRYDALGRRTREERADGTATTWSYEDCVSVSCVNANNKLIVTESELDALGAVIADRRLYTDGFDRPIAASARLLSGAYNRVEIEYDGLGRISRQSAPCWWAACTQYWTSFSHDLLGRVTETARPVSDSDPALQRSYSYYEGLTTRAVDALGKQSLSTSAVVGGLARTADHDGYSQSFDYDGFGNLVRVTDSLGATLLTNTYNVRGMRTGQSDLAAGDWSYTPNALGEIVAQRDAKNQLTSFEYDPLGRLTRRVEAEGESGWSWGRSALEKNIGRLASVSGPGYAEDYTYDSVGRLQRRTISSDASYSIDYAYNSLGVLDTLTYPASTGGYRLKLQYEYQNGQLLRVKDFNAPASVFWSANDTDARGQLISETLGNGIQTIRGYDAVTGWVDSIQSGEGSAIQDLSYGWDGVGNLRQRRDGRQGLTETFDYDNLHRLTAVSGPEPLGISYDARGNALSKTGNVSAGSSQAISWTSYNLPGVISGPSGYSSQFFYAPDRSRWRQVASYGGTGEETLYIGGLLEKVTLGSVTAWKHYIAAGSGTLAVYTRKTSGTNEIHYLTKDHLGSVDSISDGTGSLEVRLSYGSFGQRRKESTWSGNPSSGEWSGITDTTRRGYTGHEMLDNLNLVHMNGRVYDPLAGQFLSPDPFIDGALNTQGWNRYGYVKNTPLSATDPSGYWIRYLLIHPREWNVETVTVEGERIQDLAWQLQVRELQAQNERDRMQSHERPAGVIEEVITAATRYGSRGRASMRGTVSIGGGLRSDTSNCRAPTSAPGTSGTQIVIGYTEAGSSSGGNVPGASHAFVIAYNLSTGRVVATRGGPGSGPGGSAGVRSSQIVGVAGPYNTQFPDQPGEAIAYQPIGTTALSIDQVAARMANFAQVTTANNLQYSPRLNSNSYAFTFVESLGFQRPDPLIWAPGSENGLVSPKLDCAQ